MPPVGALLGAVISGITSAITAAIGTITSLVSFTGLGAFLASPIGSLLIGVGLQLISSLFVRRPNAPTIEAGKVNVRIGEPERWMNAGVARQGGGVIFAEFDSIGHFWYVIVHSDSRYAGIVKRYMDDIEITTDGLNDVVTKDFVLKNDWSTWKGSGASRKFIRLWTHTYSEGDPTPTANAQLKAAFPGANGWTDDHKLVGTTYSVIRMRPVPAEHRYKVYKWRGPVGVGEPAFSIVANWSAPYDPRTGTNAFTTNPALIWAWFRTQRYGRNKPFDSVNWDRIAEQADICDEIVAGIGGSSQKRYECHTAIPESKERATAEQEILMSCDGQIVFDDDGKTWPRVGYYYTPTLSITRNRDIFGMESVEAQNGESETQGVIVRYTNPNAKYSPAPSAPWVNPLYYVEGETPKYLVVDILSCQNHNQAMRLAKAYGYRSQSKYKLLPTVGLRGLKARQERIINLQYDNEFAGSHEIVTPVEIDESGIFTGFGIVPVDADRWRLLPGEEKSQPVVAEPDETGDPVQPTGVAISYNGSRLEATFDTVPRDDWKYHFQYKLGTESDDKWLDFSTKMDENLAVSGGVQQLKNYDVRYRTETTAGDVTDWSISTTIYTALLTVTGTPVTIGQVGVAYAGFDVNASGGETPYIFIDLYGRLPPGIDIDTSTGFISGTPTTAGNYEDVIIRVQDFNGAFNYLNSFDILINP